MFGRSPAQQKNNVLNCKAVDIRPGLILEVKTAHTLLGNHEFIYGLFVLNEVRETLICGGLKNTVRSYEYSSLSYFLLMKKMAHSQFSSVLTC